MDPREKIRTDYGTMHMEENDIYTTWETAQYQVTVQTNEASRRCQLTGSYLLSPERNVILLQDLQTHQTIYCWPYHLLRRFGQIKGGFSIEAGRRCTSGEGLFSFLSEHAAQIYRAILDAIALHNDTDPDDNKAITQRLLQVSPLSSPQVPRKPSSSNRHNSSAFCSPHSSIAPPPPHTPFISPRLLPKQRGHTPPMTDFPDRSATPPLPMRPIALPSPPMTSPLIDLDLRRKPMADFDGGLNATMSNPILPTVWQMPVPLRKHSLPLYEDEEDEDEDERCHSLDAINLDKLGLGVEVGLGVDSPYYNLRMGIIARAEEKRKTGAENSSSPCSTLKKPLQTQTAFLPLPLPTSSSYSDRLARVRGGQEPGWERLGGSASRVPVSFKQKLSDILCKDLAKFQPPVCPRGSLSPKDTDSTNAYHY